MTPFQQALVSLFGPVAVYWWETRVPERQTVLSWGCRSMSGVIVYGVVCADFKATVEDIFDAAEKQVIFRAKGGWNG